ncbi:VOC family protein [Pseudooceanicola sp. CBS1P-1]|nr:VOC family protein [Pseudooceanicola endophyticus]
MSAMSLPVQRITLVTLGVADLDRARAFYAALGWQPAAAPEGVVFYQLDGMALGLFGLQDLAQDQGRPDAPLGTGAATLAQNFTDRDGVDAAWQAALAAGATGRLTLPEPE